ncbi:MAG: hypothetical protein ACJ74Y_10750 [Bryobacteraceae bacterium]
MTQLAKMDDHQDKLLGQQLDEQYERATGGMREVLKFGAMMMMLRAHIVSTRGKVATGGADSKGTGIKAFVEKHTKKVKLSTGYRFEDVAKAVQKAYELPARVAKALPFEQLVTTPTKDLPEFARSAQEKVFEFVDGTSQRSLLDEFKEPGERGGARSKGDKNKKETAEEAHDRILECWTLLVNELSGRALGDHVFDVEWDRLTTAELRAIDDRVLRVHQCFADALKGRGRK